MRVGRLFHPVREAIAAEAGQIHHVDVLHVGARAKMLDQATIHSGLKLNPGLFVHLTSSAARNIDMPGAALKGPPASPSASPLSLPGLTRQSMLMTFSVLSCPRFS